jgi:hypothetical protein
MKIIDRRSRDSSLVSEREQVDLISYSPEMPLVLVRARRDESYIATSREALDELRGSQRQRFGWAQSRGPFAECNSMKRSQRTERQSGITKMTDTTTKATRWGDVLKICPAGGALGLHMSRRRTTFRQRDLTTAVKGVVAAGCAVARVEVGKVRDA